MSTVNDNAENLGQTGCFEGTQGIPREQLFSMKLSVRSTGSVTFYMKHDATQSDWVEEWVSDFTNHEIIGRVGVLRTGDRPPTENKEVYFTNVRVTEYVEGNVLIQLVMYYFIGGIPF